MNVVKRNRNIFITCWDFFFLFKCFIHCFLFCFVFVIKPLEVSSVTARFLQKCRDKGCEMGVNVVKSESE